ncbi:MAG TPA: phosphoadenylyl-sulfate reductase [Dehalococcoidia bacterium]|nr:phosphoadenylyl-sulfate reductase [Dehalococcoidia bacterium]
MVTLSERFTPERLSELSAELEGQPPQDILRWAFETFHDKITLACSFGGASGMALLDMAVKLRPDVRVFYLDTDFLFPETYETVRKASERYRIEPIALRPLLSVAEQAERHGEALWQRDPDACCAIRKVEPNRRALEGMEAWISGLRRDQAETRKQIAVVSWDAKFGVVKVSPLAAWTEKDVWRYIVENDVPYNPLHDRGYPSLGCTHCTRPVQPGEDARAGRWSDFDKTECGLHD